ncbi:MAG TPA: DUF4157 domain-containing protein [Candidatus Udaeobacter sp.]|nr:DUF4157 domain-containing protein [Candidatus Udaeobacter sp.]
MKVYAQKQNQPQQQVSLSITRSSAKPLAASYVVHPGMQLQRTIRNQAVQRSLHANAEGLELGSDTPATPRFTHDFSRIPVYPKTPVKPQAKLTVSTPGDLCEQEADAIADRVTRISDDQASPSKHHQSPTKPMSVRLAPSVQTKSESGAAVGGAVSKKIFASLGRGNDMEPNTQAFMHRRFGTDFSNVRIHADADAAHMNRELGAYAFTVGRDIYFGSGQYAPGTNPGRHLLAHELTHTIQQGHSTAMQQETTPRRQSIEGLGILNDEGRPEGVELPEVGPESENEAEGPAEADLSESIQMQIQRSTKWVGATVHEDLNLAEIVMNGGAPVTWHMLNGTMLKTEADADNSIEVPTLSTSGSGSDWKAKVDTVKKQEGGDDETVLAPGPWSTVVPKDDVGTKYGLAACSGADDSTFSALGKPSDNAVYKGNRRHEDQHVADDKASFEQTVVKWDKKLEKAKSKGTTFKSTDEGKAKDALWTAMGGTPQQVARKYRSLGFSKGTAFHATAKGGKMKPSNSKANPDCSISSVEIRNPS